MEINLLYIAICVFILILTGLALTVMEFHSDSSKQHEDKNLGRQSHNKQ